MQGLKSWLRKPPPPAPASRALPATGWSMTKSAADEPAPPSVSTFPEPMTLDLFEPLFLAAPKRVCFGLADGERVRVGEEHPEPRDAQPELAFDPAETVVVTPRRRAEPDVVDAGVGAAEILELQELLSERMPGLLARVDLAGKLEAHGEEASGDQEPSIAEVVAAVEAARAEVESAFALLHPDPPPDQTADIVRLDDMRSSIRFQPTPEDCSEGALLAQLHAHLEAEHEAFRAKIDALQSEFGLSTAAA